MKPCAMRRVLFVGLLATCGNQAATAHHSTAEFDYTRQVTIKGTVKEVQWTNPHSFIELMVSGSDSKLVQWSVEIGSPSLNINMGWKKSSVKPGDVITMELAPARSGKPYGTLRVLTFEDGRTLDGVAARMGGSRGGGAPGGGRAGGAPGGPPGGAPGGNRAGGPPSPGAP